MEKPLSTRIDETIIEELEAVSKLTGKKKGRIIEDALKAECKRIRAEQRK